MKTSAGAPVLCFPWILSLSHISAVIVAFPFQARNIIIFLFPFLNEFSSHTRARIVLDNNNWTTGNHCLWVADRVFDRKWRHFWSECSFWRSGWNSDLCETAAKLLIFHGLLLAKKPNNKAKIPHSDWLEKLHSSSSGWGVISATSLVWALSEWQGSCSCRSMSLSTSFLRCRKNTAYVCCGKMLD